MSFVIHVLPGRGKPQYPIASSMRRIRLEGSIPKWANSFSKSPPPGSGLPCRRRKRSPAGEEIETSPLVGKHQCIAQGVLAKHAESDSERVVRTAIAPSAPSRQAGVWRKLLPTHAESQPDASASAASCNISATVVTPMMTPRLGE